ncbi:MAG: HlyD family secretion protein, partial [Gemmatimonadales bacterium]
MPASVAGLLALLTAACGNETADAYGNFEATEVTVAAELSGRLLSFRLEEGDRVTRGSVVGVVDT